jgi:nicotinamidase-related amidase
MASDKQIRDPHADDLLTSENSAVIFIDYQPIQLASLKSEGSDEVERNVVRVARTADLYGLPTVVSSVNVESGRVGTSRPSRV